MTADPAPQAAPDDPAALRARIVELEARDAEHGRSARIQRAQSRIAEAASDSDDLGAFYATIHGIVGELMYAENFYIALYDADRRLLNYPYAVDSLDSTFPEPTTWEPMGDDAARGVTAYVLRLGRPLYMDLATFKALVASGELEQIGPVEPDSTWLGAPLLSEGRVMGLIAVQTYTADHRYDQADLDVLAFVGRHIGAALTRVRAREEIHARNAELTLVNEIGQALSRELDFDAIIDLVGERIATMFDARTMYIAMYDEAAGRIDFPFELVEGVRRHEGPMVYGDGMTSVVIDRRRPLRMSSRAEMAQNGMVHIGLDGESWLGVPILAAERVLGVIALETLEPNAYTEADERLLGTVAASMGVALENARLFDETKRLLAQTDQRAAELALINDVQRGLAEQLDMQAMYELVGERIRTIFDAQVVDIAVVDRTDGMLHYPYVFEDGQRFPDDPQEATGHHRALVMETRKPLKLDRDIRAWGESMGFPWHIQEGTRVPQSAIFVPLITAGRSAGVISLQNLDREAAFSDRDVDLLSTLASSLSVALENARLFDETKRLLTETDGRAAELAVVNEVGEALSRQLEFDAIIQLVGERVRQLFDVRSIFIALHDPTTNLISWPYDLDEGVPFRRDPYPLGAGMTSTVIRSNRPVRVGSAAEQAAAGAFSVGGTETLSWMGVPIAGASRVIGVIGLESVEEHAFSEADERLLSTLGSSMGVALENARLFDETKRLLTETDERAAELALINGVQQGLAAELDLQAMYELVGDKVQEIFDAQVVDIGIFDLDAGTTSFPYAIERGVRFPDQPAPIAGMTRKLIDERRSLRIDDMNAFNAVFGEQPVVQGEPAKAVLMAPLTSGGQVRGRISLQNLDHTFAFSDADARLLDTIAASLSVALENARLFDETKRLLTETDERAAELAIINEVQRGLAERLEMQSMYDLVGDRLRDIFDAQVLDIGIVDRDDGQIHFPYAIERGVRYPDEPMALIGIRKHVMETREPLLINENAFEVAESYGQPGVISGEAPKSTLWAPLIVGGEATGVVSLQNLDREHAFGDSDVRLLTTLATSLSVALENARLIAETRQRLTELGTVNQIGQAVASQLDLEPMYELVGDLLRDTFAADLVYVAMHDRETDRIEFAYYSEAGERGSQEGFPFGQGLTSHILRTREPLLLNRGEDWDALGQRGVGTPVKSFLGVPIVVSDQAIGVISVQSTQVEGRFGPDDRRLLSTIAANVGTAIQNARLYRETHRRATEMAALVDVGQEISSTLDPTAVLDRIVEHARSLLAGSASAVFLTQPGGQTFQGIVARGLTAEEILADTIDLGEGIIG